MSELSRRVVVFAMGGTIAMVPAESGGVKVGLSAKELAAAVPGLAETGIALELVDFQRVPGASVSFEDLLNLCRAATAAVARGVHGIVVTQGTDTIEETSYLLDLFHTADEPIVVTGAMRNPSLAGADGPANLLAALQTAADPGAAGQGALVVFNDEIHAARRVRKTHSSNVGTFQSPNGGPLGYVVEGVPRWHNRLAAGRLHIPLPPGSSLPSVGVVPVGLGDRGELLDGIESKVDALVIAAMGVGHVPEWMVSTLENLAKAMPVVLASRTAAGPVLRKTYGFIGSEQDLISRRMMPAGFLDPFKARLLLAAALAAGADRGQIARAVAVAGGYAGTGDWPWPIR
ncbi:MAG TPA: asparaginase [Candidatus Limnocylindrales bacterium]